MEYVYDEIMHQFGPKTRILVVIPLAYTQLIRINSITKSRTPRSERDEVIFRFYFINHYYIILFFNY